jgi:hypothetical protein
LKQEANRERETGAANRCDALAGNPTDPKRSGSGVTYALLKPQASEAVASCEMAVRQYPNEPRFQYELGRAMQFVDRKKAFDIQQKLVNLRYPAAYDNRRVHLGGQHRWPRTNSDLRRWIEGEF